LERTGWANKLLPQAVMVLVKPNAKPKTNIMAENWFMSDQIVENLPIIFEFLKI
jgi:hypothetical protein